MMASVTERSDSEELRKKLDAKELRAGDYQRNEETDVQRELLSKIYNPDKDTIRRELWRLREYPVELETIEETEENDSIDEESPEITDEDMKSEFRDGTEYLQWLDRQLPYLQPFESHYAVHQYYFRFWTRDEQYQFIPEMETLMEMDEDLDEVDEYVEDETDKEEIWEEGLKPDFKSGKQLVEWLGRKLPYLEPFAPDDAIHYCFNREWSREKFQPNLDVLVEEHIEDILRQDAAPQSNVAKGNIEEEIENINPYIRIMASPTILDGFLLQKKDEIRTESDEHLGENPRNEIEPPDDTLRGDTTKKDEIRTISDEHLGENPRNEVEPPDDTLRGDTTKMVLQKAAIHVRTEADGRRENPMNEFEPPVDDTLHGDTPSNTLRVTEIWSRFHKCLANKKAKMGKKKIKKEKRNKMSVLSRLFGR